jgi:hypothetical protein
VNKFIKWCPCCKAYETSVEHKTLCQLGEAEKRIAELEQALKESRKAITEWGIFRNPDRDFYKDLKVIDAALNKLEVHDETV